MEEQILEKVVISLVPYKIVIPRVYLTQTWLSPMTRGGFETNLALENANGMTGVRPGSLQAHRLT